MVKTGNYDLCREGRAPSASHWRCWAAACSQHKLQIIAFEISFWYTGLGQTAPAGKVFKTFSSRMVTKSALSRNRRLRSRNMSRPQSASSLNRMDRAFLWRIATKAP